MSFETVLQSLDCRWHQHVIRDLQAYRDAAQQGTVVGRFGRKGVQAAADMDALFTELLGDVVADKTTSREAKGRKWLREDQLEMQWR